MERIPLRRAALARLDATGLAQDPTALEPAEARRLVARLNATRGAESRQAVSGDLLALSMSCSCAASCGTADFPTGG